jgi:2-dehydropantoate 2-reductase
MKIVVMGSGGIGGYFGARLAAAGNDVTFVARGAHLAAMQAEGLKIESPLGNVHLTPTQAVRDARDAGSTDAVLFAVKMGDAEEAAASLLPLLGKETPIFAFQNGVEAADLIDKIAGVGRVVPGVARISSHIARPGVVQHVSPFARLEFAEANNTASERCKAFHAACRNAGIDATLSANIQRELWLKFAMLAPMAGVTTLTQRTAGPLRRNADTRALIEAAIQEIVSVGEVAGTGLTASDLPSLIKTIDGLPETMTSSMSHDRAAGKALELNWLSGAVVRLGQRCAVPTPTHRFIVQALALEAAGKSTPA